jgi:uncharacterized protein YegJ (DUF2314 family)
MLSESTTPDNSNPVAANAPADNPEAVSGVDKVKAFEEELKPIMENAKATLPDAKKRFLKGLKKGEAFFLTIDLRERNVVERIFVRIIKWKDNGIKGAIANDIAVLPTYKNGQVINFSESEVLDWTITKADGSEDGNYLGKYIESRGR